ncbi:MAG TPA: alpha-amylase family glycosyl hydrolase [Micropepsaceae bacterium]|nr:alpha-amylase family glycosyl hydrolase [Micropepsaceae bacterium]
MRNPAWWEHAIIYEIYARSFQDSNGDGIGDLNGITSRLDYLSWLGVNAIWITPIYPSPMKDFGYDVANYQGIDPVFGKLSDFDNLIEQAQGRGLRVILDFVPNHTSDQHPWFRESRSSRNNPKRDWYIWHDGRPDGSPPNNWISNFGGSGWEWDEATGQYYYHAFLKEQPDLNWRNPAVQTAMHNVLRFWLDRGVDGFRVDVLWHLMKDPEFRDNPPNPAYDPSQAEIDKNLQLYSADHPDIHNVVQDIRRVLDTYKDRVLIGEIYLPMERLVAYYGKETGEAHLPFNFQLLQTPWNARRVGAVIREYDGIVPEQHWPNWVLGNHDKPRIAARIGLAQARVAAMLLLTLRGTPTMYYGDEIGIAEMAIPKEFIRDPWERNEPGLGLGRDPQRTPMQWDRSANAGFTTGIPWLPLAADCSKCNVETLSQDPDSILSLYRRLISYRQSSHALTEGKYRQIELSGGDDLLCYERRVNSDHAIVLLNFGDRHDTAEAAEFAGLKVVIATHAGREGEIVGAKIKLQANEGLILAPA